MKKQILISDVSDLVHYIVKACLKSPSSRLAELEETQFSHLNGAFSWRRNAESGLFKQALRKGNSYE